jgi:hypothetical protein
MSAVRCPSPSSPLSITHLLELLERRIRSASVGIEYGVGGVLGDGLAELVHGLGEVALGERFVAARLGGQSLEISAAQRDGTARTVSEMGGSEGWLIEGRCAIGR